MAENNITDAEKRIINAARSVFLNKGYFGARMQEIADAAGINKAMLHYYYRSKDKLYDIIVVEAISEGLSKAISILNDELPFEDKIRGFINTYMDLLTNNQTLPVFIFNELHQNPERVKSLIGEKIKLLPKVFIQQVNAEVKSGRIRQIEPLQLLLNIISLCIFPFIAKPIFGYINDLPDEAFQQFLSERRKILPDIIFHGINK